MKPDWKDAPEWARFLAQDENREWYWFEAQPVKEAGYWCRGHMSDRMCRAGVKLPLLGTCEERPS